MSPQNIYRIIEAGARTAKSHQGRSQIENLLICTAGYAEPGYSDPKGGVIAFGNWNEISHWNPTTRTFEKDDDTPCRVAKLLEKGGVELEWSDEWTTCDLCGKAVRTKPDGYSWKRYYAETDDGISCGDCIQANPSDYLESLEGQDSSCVTIDLDLADHGYVLLEDGFQNGFHGGQDADPAVISKSLREQGIERFIFRLDYTGQFDISFSVLVHKNEIDKINQDEYQDAPKNGPSISQGLQRSLESASRQMAELPDIPGHPKIARCDASTGTARVKVVTPEEFVEGNALNF